MSSSTRNLLFTTLGLFALCAIAGSAPASDRAVPPIDGEQYWDDYGKWHDPRYGHYYTLPRYAPPRPRYDRVPRRSFYRKLYWRH